MKVEERNKFDGVSKNFEFARNELIQAQNARYAALLLNSSVLETIFTVKKFRK